MVNIGGGEIKDKTYFIEGQIRWRDRMAKPPSSENKEEGHRKQEEDLSGNQRYNRIPNSKTQFI